MSRHDGGPSFGRNGAVFGVAVDEDFDHIAIFGHPFAIWKEEFAEFATIEDGPGVDLPKVGKFDSVTDRYHVVTLSGFCRYVNRALKVLVLNGIVKGNNVRFNGLEDFAE